MVKSYIAADYWKTTATAEMIYDVLKVHKKAMMGEEGMFKKI